jgi:hypothetical protein
MQKVLQNRNPRTKPEAEERMYNCSNGHAIKNSLQETLEVIVSTVSVRDEGNVPLGPVAHWLHVPAAPLPHVPAAH